MTVEIECPHCDEEKSFEEEQLNWEEGSREDVICDSCGEIYQCETSLVAQFEGVEKEND